MLVANREKKLNCKSKQTKNGRITKTAKKYKKRNYDDDLNWMHSLFV